jgi:hypothetical protein
MSEPQFSPCEQALHVVHGARREAYGDAAQSLRTIADLWGPILKKHVTNEEVALCMIQLKIARELNKHQDDNLTDICGYVEVLNQSIRETGYGKP